MPGEAANISKAQYLYGRHGCICGGYKREGECALTRGDLMLCPRSTTVVSRWGGVSEVSRGHRLVETTEGPNVIDGVGAFNFDGDKSNS